MAGGTSPANWIAGRIRALVTDSSRTRRRFLRDAGLVGAATTAAPFLTPAFGADGDPEAPFCPHPNPIVHENRCTNPDTFGAGFQVSGTTSVMGGFARQTSVDVGSPVELVISGPNNYLPPSGDAPLETVEVDVYRLGYYDGLGGRRVWSTSGPVSTFQKVDALGAPSNDGTYPPDEPVDATTGLSGRANWRTVVTVPPEALTVSGVYVAKLRGKWVEYPPGAPSVERSGDSQAVFIVRDDARARDLLVLLPTNTWQAYNYWGGRSTYTYNSRYGSAGSIVPATGTERAAKVSFDRPHNNWVGDYNWVLRTEFPAIWWLERHGYDVAYTEDVALGLDPAQALPDLSKGVMVLGHGEYWSQGLRDGLQDARDAGTSLYNLGANVAYWRVRHETVDGDVATSVEDARVMAIYKTVEGGGSSATTTGGGADSGSGSPTVNEATIASLADPVSPTTTWRDPGKGPGIDPPGTAAATPASYAGPNRPEAELLGVQYIGDDDARNRGLTVPAATAGRAGEFAAHSAWRHTPVAGKTTTTTIGAHLVGWEWDAIPPPGSPYAGTPPATKDGTGGVRRLSETDPRVNPPPGAQTAYLMDAGRQYSARGAAAQPPAGGSAVAHAVSYVAPSGALVFSSGTIQWSWGLGPHYLHRNTDSYASAPVDTTDSRIVQATTNLLADGGIVPITPEGLLFDPPPEPEPTTPTTPTTPPTTPEPTTPTTPEPTTPVDGGGTPPVTPPVVAPPTPNPPAPNPPTPTPPIPALKLRLLSSKATAAGRLKAQITAGQQLPRAIRGTVELTLDGKRLARASFSMRTTKSGTITLKLSAAARARLLRKGKLKPLGRVIVTENGKTVRTDLVRLTITRAKK